MIGLIAQKIEMSRLTLDNGDVVGATWLHLPPNTVAQVKRLEKDGYSAIQLAMGQAKHYTKSLKGHLKTIDAKILREIKVDNADQYQRGDKLDVSLFAVGDKVRVTAMSKGKGFAGTIKRHHFKSGPGSHGHDHHRQPGSIGAMGIPRVEPGRRMSGHMGMDKVTTKNLLIVAVDPTAQRLAIQGSVPGHRKSYVLIQKPNA
ncbi:TPA: 50S ribosomal protein L3 [Patescibacteria group bacterium]|nr:50S ribosomal protein L3 [Patescibacteria group bacterium]